MQNMKLLNIPA